MQTEAEREDEIPEETKNIMRDIMRRVVKAPGADQLGPVHLRALAEMNRRQRRRALSRLRRGIVANEAVYDAERIAVI